MGNSEMQILRWGIPGWVTILSYFLLKLSLNNYEIDIWLESIDAGLLAGIAATLTVVGIPLGYIVYQIYFFIKWKFFKQDRKINNLFSSITLYQELSSGNGRRAMDTMEKWKVAERTFNIFLSEYIRQGNISYEDVMRQYKSFQSRTHRVHGLGASIAGIVISVLFFIIYQFCNYGVDVLANVSFIITLDIIMILSYILYSNYKQADIDSFKQMRGIIIDIGISILENNPEMPLENVFKVNKSDK